MIRDKISEVPQTVVQVRLQTLQLQPLSDMLAFIYCIYLCCTWASSKQINNWILLLSPLLPKGLKVNLC